MIIDVHAHAFPHFGGPYGDLSNEQERVRGRFGRMRTSILDEKFIPEPFENVNFRVGKYGKLYWTKHGVECWIRRFPMILTEIEWPPENTIEYMDAIGVDKAVLQAGYMKIDYCREFFSECMKKWPERFIGTVNINYDINKDEKYRETELEKLRESVNKIGMRGVFQGFPLKQRLNIDDKKFEPFWEEISRLKIPHFFMTGVQGGAKNKQEFLESLSKIENVLKKFTNVNGIIGHLGGNIKPPNHPDFTDTPKELMKILCLPNAYFEVGYVLAYDNWDVWKKNYEYPYPLHTKLIKTIYDEVGAERLLWGSDIPNIYRTCTYQQCLDLVRLHFDFLSEKEKNMVLGGNSAKLFRV